LPVEEAQATAVDVSLGRDPAMRWIVGGKAIEGQAASTSQMGRFETYLLASDENFAALTDISGVWIDRVHGVAVLAPLSGNLINGNQR
jgi:hypothetical protein